MILGAEAVFPTEIALLDRRGHIVVRLSADVDVKPSVDLLGILIQLHRRTNPGFSMTGSGGASLPVPPRRRTVRTK